MAKHSKQHRPASTPPVENTIKPVGSATHSSPASLFSARNQLIVLFALCFVFYGNTLNHGFAFDDTMAIVDNEYVLQGLSGIPKILSSDAYQSYLEKKGGNNQLAGGRYRPLSLVTFAVEQQFLGTIEPDEAHKQLSPTEEDARNETITNQMHVRHFVNVLLYACVIAAIYILIAAVAPAGLMWLPLVVSVVFLILPIHTEVVANVKSRDELLSLLFICFTFTFYTRFLNNSQTKYRTYALVCFFLALLAKEYAITLVLLLPLFHYLTSGNLHRKPMNNLLMFLIPLGVYLALRVAAVSGPGEGAEKNIMNYPYLFATASQKLATEFFVTLQYLKLMILPHPLLVDYSFAQVPYTGFGNPMVWVAIAVLMGSIGGIVYLVKNKNLLGFALAFYFANLALVTNFFFNVGAPMGERLAFHSSLGFAVIVGWLIVAAAGRIRDEKKSFTLTIGLLIGLTLPCAALTINRNADWRNNETLFLHDVQEGSNSVLINNDAAAACMAKARQQKDTAMRSQWLQKAITYYDQAIKIHPRYSLAILNRGLCYYNSGNPLRALQDWDTVRVQNPGQPNLSRYLGIAAKLLVNKGLKAAHDGNLEAAIENLTQATEAAPEYADAWMNLGLVYRNSNHIPEAKNAIEHVLKLNPANKDAQLLFAQLNQ